MGYPEYNTPFVKDGHFLLAEYALLRMWNTLAIPSQDQLKRAQFLFSQVETLIRVPLGKPLTISSGARTGQYSTFLRSLKIPAALNSAHNTWEAVDLEPPVGMTNAEFWHWCDARWPGRMENLSATPSWVHLDIRSWGSRMRFNP